MNDVLEYFRERIDPRFKSVPDNLLTEYIYERHPEFLKDPGFRRDIKLQFGREQAAAETAAESAATGLELSQEQLGRGAAGIASGLGQFSKLASRLSPLSLAPFLSEATGVGEQLRSYGTVGEQLQAPSSLKDIAQSYRERGALDALREAGALATGSIVEQAPQLTGMALTGGALNAVGVPAKAATYLAPLISVAPQEAGGAYQEIGERTGQQGVGAAGGALGVGILNAALERFGVGGIVGDALDPARRAVSRSLLGAAARSAGQGILGEGVTEGLQETVTALTPELYGATRDPNLAGRIAEAAAVGAVTGGAFSGPIGAYQYRSEMADLRSAMDAENAYRTALAERIGQASVDVGEQARGAMLAPVGQLLTAGEMARAVPPPGAVFQQDLAQVAPQESLDDTREQLRIATALLQRRMPQAEAPLIGTAQPRAIAESAPQQFGLSPEIADRLRQLRQQEEAAAAQPQSTIPQQQQLSLIPDETAVQVPEARQPVVQEGGEGAQGVGRVDRPTEVRQGAVPADVAGGAQVAPEGQLKPSARPSDILSPRSRVAAPPRPDRNGRDTSAQDAWDAQYGNMRRGGRTHNDDGTPYQPTLLDEVMVEFNNGLSSASDAASYVLRTIGSPYSTGAGNAVGEMLDGGWVWDDQLGRMVDPSDKTKMPWIFWQEQAAGKIAAPPAVAPQAAPAAPTQTAAPQPTQTQSSAAAQEAVAPVVPAEPVPPAIIEAAAKQDLPKLSAIDGIYGVLLPNSIVPGAAQGFEYALGSPNAGEPQAVYRRRKDITGGLYSTAAWELASKPIVAAPPVIAAPQTAPVEEPASFTIEDDGLDGVEVPYTRVPKGAQGFQYAVGTVSQGARKTVFKKRPSIFKRTLGEGGEYGPWQRVADAESLISLEPEIKPIEGPAAAAPTPAAQAAPKIEEPIQPPTREPASEARIKYNDGTDVQDGESIEMAGDVFGPKLGAELGKTRIVGDVTRNLNGTVTVTVTRLGKTDRIQTASTRRTLAEKAGFSLGDSITFTPGPYGSVFVSRKNSSGQEVGKPVKVYLDRKWFSKLQEAKKSSREIAREQKRDAKGQQMIVLRNSVDAARVSDRYPRYAELLMKEISGQITEQEQLDLAQIESSLTQQEDTFLRAAFYRDFGLAPIYSRVQGQLTQRGLTFDPTLVANEWDGRILSWVKKRIESGEYTKFSVNRDQILAAKNAIKKAMEQGPVLSALTPETEEETNIPSPDIAPKIQEQAPDAPAQSTAPPSLFFNAVLFSDLAEALGNAEMRLNRNPLLRRRLTQAEVSEITNQVIDSYENESVNRLRLSDPKLYNQQRSELVQLVDGLYQRGASELISRSAFRLEAGASDPFFELLSSRILNPPSGVPAASVSKYLSEQYGVRPDSGLIAVLEDRSDSADSFYNGRLLVVRPSNRPIGIQINAARLGSVQDVDRVLLHEFSHWALVNGVAADVLETITPEERADIQETVAQLGYDPTDSEELDARKVEQLVLGWRNRNWFQRLIGKVLAWGNSLGLRLTRLAAESIAARAVAIAESEAISGTRTYDIGSNRVYEVLDPVSAAISKIEQLESRTTFTVRQEVAEELGRPGLLPAQKDIIERSAAAQAGVVPVSVFAQLQPPGAGSTSALRPSARINLQWIAKIIGLSTNPIALSSLPASDMYTPMIASAVDGQIQRFIENKRILEQRLDAANTEINSPAHGVKVTALNQAANDARAARAAANALAAKAGPSGLTKADADRYAALLNDERQFLDVAAKLKAEIDTLTNTILDSQEELGVVDSVIASPEFQDAAKQSAEILEVWTPEILGMPDPSRKVTRYVIGGETFELKNEYTKEGDEKAADETFRMYAAVISRLNDIASSSDPVDPAEVRTLENLKLRLDTFALQESENKSLRAPLWNPLRWRRKLPLFRTTVARQALAYAIPGRLSAKFKTLNNAGDSLAAALGGLVKNDRTVGVNALNEATHLAIRSHPELDYLGNEKALVWNDQILNEILNANQSDTDFNVTAGMTTPFGHVITKEDMAAAELQAKFAHKVYSVATARDRLGLIEFFPNKVYENGRFRLPFLTGALMVPRRLGRNRNQGRPAYYAEQIVKAVSDPTLFSEADRQAAIEAILAEPKAFLTIARRYVWETNSEFRNKSRFAKAYGQLAVEWWTNKRTPPKNLDELVQQIAAVDGKATEDEVRSALLTEIAGTSKAVLDAENTSIKDADDFVRNGIGSDQFSGTVDSPSAIVNVVDSFNQFTKPRGGMVAPGVFYDYTLSQSHTQNSLIVAAQMPILIQQIKSMMDLENAMLQQRSELADRMNRDRSSVKADLRSGKLYSSWYHLNEDLQLLSELKEQLKSRVADPSLSVGDRIMNAVANFQRANYVANPASAIKNIIFGKAGGDIATSIAFEGNGRSIISGAALGPRLAINVLSKLFASNPTALRFIRKNRAALGWIGKRVLSDVQEYNDIMAATRKGGWSPEKQSVSERAAQVSRMGRYGSPVPGRGEVSDDMLNRIEQLAANRAIALGFGYLYKLQPGGDVVVNQLNSKNALERLYKAFQAGYNIIKNKESTGKKDWNNWVDRTNAITPEEAKQVAGWSRKTLFWMREQLAPAGSLESVLHNYYKRVNAAKAAGIDPKTVPLFANEDILADILLKGLALSNLPTDSSRADVIRANNAMGRVINFSFAYPGWFSAWTDKLEAFTSRDAEERYAQGPGWKLAYDVVFIAIIIMALMEAGLWASEVYSILYPLINARPYPMTTVGDVMRDPSPETIKKLGGTLLAGMVPYFGELAAGALGATQNRPSLTDLSRTSVQLGLLSNLYETAKYLTITGDYGGAALRLARGQFPFLNPVVNRVFAEGRDAVNDAVRVATRSAGPLEIKTRPGGGFEPTEFSSLVKRAVAAQADGDPAAAKALLQKAAEVKAKEGVSDPWSAVKSSLKAQAPEIKAFGRKLSEDERAGLLGRMSGSQRAIFEKAESAIGSLVGGIGTKAEREAATGGGGLSAAQRQIRALTAPPKPIKAIRKQLRSAMPKGIKLKRSRGTKLGGMKMKRSRGTILGGMKMKRGRNMGIAGTKLRPPKVMSAASLSSSRLLRQGPLPTVALGRAYREQRRRGAAGLPLGPMTYGGMPSVARGY